METPSAPLTPLGARTHLTHPALYGVIVSLSFIIIAGMVWIFWPQPAGYPAHSPSPTDIPSTFEYRINAYGLSVTLPESWRGFRDVTPGMEWFAYDVTTGRGVDSGPIITLQHPEWTQEARRQDISIMVFTHEQWAHVSGPDGDWSVGAAPVPPTELIRNSRYVFALPARYNYAFHEGWEEVDDMIRKGAIHVFEP